MTKTQYEINLNNIKNIRLWDQNPRFTPQDEVDFDKMGKNDFGKSDIEILENQKIIMKSILSKLIKVEKFVDLIQDIIENGFREDIDELIISNTENINTNNFYVIEGNRRFLALFIIYDLNSSRDILRDFFGTIWSKIEKMILENDKNHTFQLNFFCSLYENINNKSKEKIMFILNSKHFGERIGKENWPRGTIINSIFKYTKKYKDNNKEEDNTNLKIYLKRHFGKVINDFDLRASLLCTEIISIFNNSKNVDDEEKIDFGDTDDGILDSRNKFSISSLELAFSTIKILDDKLDLVTLKELIGLNVDLLKWEITYNKIDKIQWETLSIFIVNEIKKGEINTRKSNDYTNNIIKNIINDNQTKKENYFSKKTKKDFSQAPLSYIKNISKSKNPKDQEEFNEYLKSYPNMEKFINSVIPLIDKTSSIFSEIEKNINKIDDVLIKSICTLWAKDFKYIISAKAQISNKFYPYSSISFFIRNTRECILNFLFIKSENMRKLLFDCKLDKQFTKEQIEKSILNDFKKEHMGSNLYNLITKEKKKTLGIDDWRRISEDICVYLKKNNPNDKEYTEYINSNFTTLSKEIATHLRTLFSSTEDHWNEINNLIHNSHYIYEIEKKSVFNEFYKNFDSCLVDITFFAEIIKSLLEIKS